MRHWIRVAVWLLLVGGGMPAMGEEITGIVLLHGKEGRPEAPQLVRLAARLREAGYRVSSPEMPWSRRRIYDADVDGAMAEIAHEEQVLRGQGATRVVVIGHSLGANAAFRYAATYRPDGMVALAPGHNPDALYRQLGPDVRRARQMVAEGRGEERASFGDINVGHTLQVQTSARIYLSWLDPEGPALMERNAASMAGRLPALIVVGTRDPVARPQSALFDKLPAHPASRYLRVEADHVGVPEAAGDALLAWLKSW